MRKYTFTFMFLFSISVFSQINLSVHLKRSQSENSITYIVDTLKIYKNNSLYKAVPNPDSFALYESVSAAIYKFSYKNLFDEQIDKVVDLRESNNVLGGQTIDLYVDQLQNPKTENLFFKNIIALRTITIRILYSGCFNSGEENIKITNLNNKLFVNYNGKKRRLNKADIDALIRFETELRNLPNPKIISTANSRNEIIIENDFFSYNEPGDFWGGFDILKKNLKL